MVQEYSIKEIKQKLKRNNDEILGIIIRGTIDKINEQIIYNNQQYFNFNLTDGNDHLVVAILQTNESQEKINFIIETNKSKKKIIIKEPRRPYLNLNRNKIDLIISSQNPPIGTEIIEDSQHIKELDTGSTKLFSENKIKTTNSQIERKNEMNSFKSALTLLDQEMEKSEDYKEKKFLTIEQFIEFLNQYKKELRNIEFFDTIELEKIAFKNINFIISLKKEQGTLFESKFDFFIDKSEKNYSISILKFNIYNEIIYRTIKDNLSFFSTKEYYSQIKEIWGLNK